MFFQSKQKPNNVLKILVNRRKLFITPAGNIQISGVLALFVLCFCIRSVHAEPSLLGQTGLINMPDARIEESGTLRFGYAYYEPYPTLWSTISMFSRLEFGARYTRFMRVTAFGGQENYGDYKDKAFDAKLTLLKESKYLPRLSVGVHDFIGTKLLKDEYVALNKRFGSVDVTLGYGRYRIDGVFGGVRYKPQWLKGFGFVAEYDAFDYKNDPYANQSKVDQKPGGATYAIEYRWGWLGSQVSYQDGDWGANAYFSIPLNQKEFIPKIDEPPPFSKQVYRPTIQEWQQDSKYKRDLIRALETQGYKNVRVLLNDNTLELGFSQPRMTYVGRVIGRGVRTALLMSPIGTQSIKLTYYSEIDEPLLTYHFKDLPQLEAFFSGTVTYGELVKNLTVSYAEPKYTKELERNTQLLPTSKGAGKLEFKRNEEGHAISLKQETNRLTGFFLIPFGLGIYFNDPSGAFRYDLFALARYRGQLGKGLFINGAVRMTLSENVSDVTQESNSLLPHVRSDVAKYKGEDNLFKLNDVYLNQYFHLMPRVYGRLTLGYYEEMFGGTGGQLIYIPKSGSWAVDATVDWLKQRDYDGGFGFRDYETVTALMAFHYNIKKYGVTLTARGGRFLAKDSGVRFEFARTFKSGAKVGAWYTYTDGEDTTSPGSPSNPYYDKGVFFSLPLSALLTKDTKAKGGFSLSPWTRDVGQMVKSPGDLYDAVEEPLLFNRPDQHLLTDFHY
jgi:hypothetical protein